MLLPKKFLINKPFKIIFQHTVAHSDWGNFCVEGMFTAFKNIIETALKKSVPKKKVFTRNDKSDITIPQKWKNKTQLYRERTDE